MPLGRLDTLSQLRTWSILCPKCIYYRKTNLIRLAKPMYLIQRQNQLRCTSHAHAVFTVILIQVHFLNADYIYLLSANGIPTCPQNKLSDKAARKMHFLLPLPQQHARWLHSHSTPKNVLRDISSDLWSLQGNRLKTWTSLTYHKAGGMDSKQ